MAKEKILIIEDEEDIQELIRYNLNKEGFQNLRVVDSGEKALAALKSFSPDVILLDLMLPGMDGLAVCRHLRSAQETATIPIIMLTAKSEETDIIIGLEMGADDYIAKPFSNKVLVARIKSVLRRSKQTFNDDGSGIIRRGGLVMNRGKREVNLSGKSITMTFSEFEILYMLAKRPGWVFTRNQIVNEVKGDDYPVTERAIDVQIVGLRKKLKGAENMIETVRGVGYRFKND